MKKINALIKEIDRNGFKSEGKPEPLTGNLSEFWSVHIDKKNRTVFRINGDELEIAQCGSHYKDK